MNELVTSIMSIIQDFLVTPFVWLFPIKWIIIIPGSSGIRYTFGKPSKELKPGIHLATIGQTLHKEHVENRLSVPESMYVLTEDYLSLRVRGVLIYKIVSLVKFMTSTEDSEVFVTEVCEAAIKSTISITPFEDLVVDSETVEQNISSNISKICKELGIRVKKYRFQDIEIVDPIGRSLCSVKSMTPKLIESAKIISKELNISTKDALIILSPNIQLVSNVESCSENRQDVGQEEEEEEFCGP